MFHPIAPGPKPTMARETELTDTFERMLHRDFPNPQRIGCPGREELRLLVEPSTDSEYSYLFEHIRQCAPCFDELKEMRRARA